MMKTKAKRSLSISFFSKSHVTMSLISFQRGPAFPLVFFFIASTYRTFSCCSWCLWPDLILSGFFFPNLIPGCSGNFSVFLSGCLSLLPSSVGFFFVCLFEFAQKPIAHLCRPPGFLEASRALSHGIISNSSLKRPKSALLKGVELAVCPPCSHKDLEPHCFMVTAAQAALELHMPHQPCLGESSAAQLLSSLALLSLGEGSYHQRSLYSLLLLFSLLSQLSLISFAHLLPVSSSWFCCCCSLKNSYLVLLS